MKFSCYALLFFSIVLSMGFKPKKKILFINSYHRGYIWSDKIEQGVRSVLDGRDDIHLEFKYMDSKRNKDPDYISSKASEIKSYIDEYKPDLVIASDDNASKFLIHPFYKDHKIPFVFCGVNWSGDNYGFPYKNVTGMVEVSPIKLAFKYFKEFSGKDVKEATFAHIEEDTISGQKNADHVESHLGIKLRKEYAKNFEEWKKIYLNLSDHVDFIILGGNAGVKNWNKEEAIRFVEENVKTITATDVDWMIPFSLFGFVKIPEEQGEWAAKTALEILAGKSPSSIPIAKNQQGHLMLNMKIAKKLKIKVPYALVTKAKVIIK